MGRVRHAQDTRDRDQGGHESVEKTMAIGKQKNIIIRSIRPIYNHDQAGHKWAILELGETKTGFFFCAAQKKGVWKLDRSDCCCSINQQVDKGQNTTANAHCLATTTATNVSCIAITT